MDLREPGRSPAFLVVAALAGLGLTVGGVVGGSPLHIGMGLVGLASSARLWWTRDRPRPQRSREEAAAHIAAHRGRFVAGFSLFALVLLAVGALDVRSGVRRDDATLIVFGGMLLAFGVAVVVLLVVVLRRVRNGPGDGSDPLG